MNKNIECTSDYINLISNITSKYYNQNKIFLYRGENQIFDKGCYPNIFRNNYLLNNNFFEQSLLNSIRQNKLTQNDNYLENAIDAQHSEFPSRLLDVSYNCLIALYFAVTPPYKYNIDHDDNKDGIVYVFSTEYLYSPSSQNIINNYNAIIDQKVQWFNNQPLFQKNHKFIDNTKINKRIIAQQGAFILFQGNDCEFIPNCMSENIIIPKEAKAKIRSELSTLFGISTGYVFPEVVHLVDDLVYKSKFFITDDFNLHSELKYTLSTFKNETQKYLEFFERNNKNDENLYLNVQSFEKLINSYKLSYFSLINDLKKKDNEFYKKNLKSFEWFKDSFNKEINEIYIIMNNDLKLKFSNDLKIGSDK